MKKLKMYIQSNVKREGNVGIDDMTSNAYWQVMSGFVDHDIQLYHLQHIIYDEILYTIT